KNADGLAYPPSAGRFSTKTRRPSPATASPSTVFPAADTAAAVIGDSQDPYGAVTFAAPPEAWGCIAAVRLRSAGKRLASVDEERLRGGAAELKEQAADMVAARIRAWCRHRTRRLRCRRRLLTEGLSCRRVSPCSPPRTFQPACSYASPRTLEAHGQNHGSKAIEISRTDQCQLELPPQVHMVGTGDGMQRLVKSCSEKCNVC
ncbi:unnamed protein product, partial [Urochloa humidicola]